MKWRKKLPKLWWKVAANVYLGLTAEAHATERPSHEDPCRCRGWSRRRWRRWHQAGEVGQKNPDATHQAQGASLTRQRREALKHGNPRTGRLLGVGGTEGSCRRQVASRREDGRTGNALWRRSLKKQVTPWGLFLFHAGNQCHRHQVTAPTTGRLPSLHGGGLLAKPVPLRGGCLRGAN